MTIQKAITGFVFSESVGRRLGVFSRAVGLFLVALGVISLNFNPCEASTNPIIHSYRQTWSANSNRPKISKCTMGEYTYPLGSRFHPSLPIDGRYEEQKCLICECTLKLVVDCYRPSSTCRRVDLIPGMCPEVPETCADGSRPIRPKDACCLSCHDETSATSTTSSPRVLWMRNRRRQQQQTTRVEKQQNLVKYDDTARTESYWLFKIVARDQNDTEFISAVKSVPLCH